MLFESHGEAGGKGGKAPTGTQEMVAVWAANASGRAIHCLCDLLLRLAATSDDIKASVRLAEETRRCIEKETGGGHV